VTGITTATHRRVVEFTDPCSKAIYFRISVGNGVSGVIMVAVRVRVRGGAARAVPESLLQDLHDLEVGYVVFASNACEGA
jgi:hypothetical protein